MGLRGYGNVTDAMQKLLNWRVCPHCGAEAGVLKTLDEPRVVECHKCKTTWTREEPQVNIADPKLWPTPTAEQAAKFLQEQASPIWRTCPNCGKLTGVLRKLDDPQVIVCPRCRTTWTLNATNGDDIARD